MLELLQPSSSNSTLNPIAMTQWEELLSAMDRFVFNLQVAGISGQGGRGSIRNVNASLAGPIVVDAVASFLPTTAPQLAVSIAATGVHKLEVLFEQDYEAMRESVLQNKPELVKSVHADPLVAKRSEIVLQILQCRSLFKVEPTGIFKHIPAVFVNLLDTAVWRVAELQLTKFWPHQDGMSSIDSWPIRGLARKHNKFLVEVANVLYKDWDCQEPGAEELGSNALAVVSCARGAFREPTMCIHIDPGLRY